MRLIAVHSRLRVRSGYPSVYASRDGQSDGQLIDGPSQPFPGQVKSLPIHEFTTSTTDSELIPSSDPESLPNSTTLATDDVRDTTVHSTHLRDPSVTELVDTANYTATASSI